jgi:hypothetical protein
MLGHVLGALFLAALALLLVSAIADGQVSKKVAGGKSGKSSIASSAKTQWKPGADQYSIAAERKALREIRKRARVEVRELSERLSSLPAEADRRILQRRIVKIKKEYRLEHLRTKAHFALGRGDLEAAHEIDQVIERILKPRFSAPGTSAEKDVPFTQKGGRP